MNILAASINMFTDKDIVNFLKKDFDSNYTAKLRMAIQER